MGQPEYYPSDLKANLCSSGFEIVDERGICQMENTLKTNQFDYQDFILGSHLTNDVNSGYIQYYKCKKKVIR